MREFIRCSHLAVKFRALNVYIRKQERSKKINYLWFHLKKLEKEQQSKHKVDRRKVRKINGIKSNKET